jgi:hypothetical protein
VVGRVLREHGSGERWVDPEGTDAPDRLRLLRIHLLDRGTPGRGRKEEETRMGFASLAKNRKI